MGFGSCLSPSLQALFANPPIGAILAVGMDSGFWIGTFAGFQDGVVVLTKAQLRSNLGGPIDGFRPIVRIPLKNVTFVST